LTQYVTNTFTAVTGHWGQYKNKMQHQCAVMSRLHQLCFVTDTQAYNALCLLTAIMCHSPYFFHCTTGLLCSS